MSSKKFHQKDEQEKEEKRSKVQCYECKEYGHIKYDCLNKEKEKKEKMSKEINCSKRTLIVIVKPIT